MLLYTDGIVEAKDQTGEEYGYDRLKTAFEATLPDDPSLIIKNIINNLYAFCGHQNLDDDYTILSIKFTWSQPFSSKRV